MLTPETTKREILVNPCLHNPAALVQTSKYFSFRGRQAGWAWATACMYVGLLSPAEGHVSVFEKLKMTAKRAQEVLESR